MLSLLVNDCFLPYLGGFHLLSMQPHHCGQEENFVTDWFPGLPRRNETYTGCGSGLKYRYTTAKARSA